MDRRWEHLKIKYYLSHGPDFAQKEFDNEKALISAELQYLSAMLMKEAGQLDGMDLEKFQALIKDNVT